MKKLLKGTTALAAVGLAAGAAQAAEPLHIEVGGYWQEYYGYVDPDFNANGNTNTASFARFNNSEVYFKMRGELDNGLKIGGRWELEGEQSGDQIDQQYLILAGGFGELRLGQINSGRYSYGWNTDSPNVGVGINSGWISTMVAARNNSGFRFRSPALSTVIDASNDESKITYFTPRFNGFQFTVSWTPDGDLDTNNGIGQGGETFAVFTGPRDEGTFYTNGFDFGLSYSGEYQGVGIEAQAGIATAQAPDNTNGSIFSDDYLAYNGGLSVSFSGFTVAGSFAVVDQPLAFNCTAAACTGAGVASNEGTSYSFGIGYSTGPWGFSATYFNGQEEGLVANPGDEENEFVAVAGSYTLGPGIRTSLSYVHAELEDDLPGNAGDNEGDAVMWGWHLGF